MLPVYFSKKNLWLTWAPAALNKEVVCGCMYAGNVSGEKRGNDVWWILNWGCKDTIR